MDEYEYTPPNKPKADWTIGEVRKFAIQTNDKVLYTCTKMYDHGYCTWAETMQAAAIESAIIQSRLFSELVSTKSRSISQPLITE